jgi:hypothetical protein
MPDHELEPMLEEYRQLFSYVNTNAITTLAIPPVVVTVATGIAVFSKEISPLFGLGTAIAIFVMLVWLGYCHCMVNGIGLRLVELEQRMNHKLKRNATEGFSFHTWYIAQGGNLMPGFNFYSVLLFLVFALVLAGSLVQFWSTMSNWRWDLWAKILGVVLPSAFILAALVNMVLAELKTRKMKANILRTNSTRA